MQAAVARPFNFDPTAVSPLTSVNHVFEILTSQWLQRLDFSDFCLIDVFLVGDPMTGVLVLTQIMLSGISIKQLR